MGRKKIAIIAVAVLVVIGVTAFILKHNNKVVYKDKDTTATVSKSGDSGKVTTKDGSLDYGSNISWPSKDMGNLPKVNAKITSVIKGNSNNTCSVYFKDMSENDAKDYKNKLISLGYSKSTDATDNGAMYFCGTSSKGETVCFSYNTSTKEGNVIYTLESNSQGTQSTEKTDKTTDLAKWPGDIMGSIPELEGKITNVSKSNDKDATIDLEYVDKAVFNSYLDKIKELGFTESLDKVEENNFIRYGAYNKNGDYINIVMNLDKDNNKVTIRFDKASE